MFRMVLLLGLMVFLGSSVFAQTEEEEKAKQKAEMERQMRIYERNPERYRDSVAQVRTRQSEERAQARLANYRANTRLDTLKEIDLSYMRLDELPGFLDQATGAEVLLLDHNNIRKLSKQLREMKSLKRIYWRNQDFQGKKAKSVRLDSVEKLDLSSNRLSDIPNMRKFRNLKTLELKDNELTEIPIRRLKKATTLEEVSIGNNPIQIGPDKYEKLAFLKKLKVNTAKLTSIDPSLYRMTGLDELQLAENELTTLPEGISNLQNLTKFSAYKNQLTGLPTDFWQLKKLKVADLYYNQLEVIPDDITNLKDMEVLYLSHNKIYNLPKDLGELTRLKELYVHHNRLSVIPGSIVKMENLQVVRVNDNYLTTFPKAFLYLQNLREIDVNKNELTTLPAEIEGLTNLQLFTFQDNPIDLNIPENHHISYMIDRMLKRGVSCLPRIYKNEAPDTPDVSDM